MRLYACRQVHKARASIEWLSCCENVVNNRRCTNKMLGILFTNDSKCYEWRQLLGFLTCSALRSPSPFSVLCTPLNYIVFRAVFVCTSCSHLLATAQINCILPHGSPDGMDSWSKYAYIACFGAFHIVTLPRSTHCLSAVYRRKNKIRVLCNFNRTWARSGARFEPHSSSDFFFSPLSSKYVFSHLFAVFLFCAISHDSCHTTFDIRSVLRPSELCACVWMADVICFRFECFFCCCCCEHIEVKKVTFCLHFYPLNLSHSK